METPAHNRIRVLCLGIICVMTLAVTNMRTEIARAAHTDDEQYNMEIEEYTDWFRRQSSSIRRKIDRLDEDPVRGFEIPILFGVTLDDITPNFGDPRGGGTRTHEGLDILAPKGTPVVTPTDAVVMRTGKGSSAGRYVYTANPGGETFVYMHLNEIANIEEGDVLDAGELVGYVGDTGNANGVSHLHFEVRDDSRPTDPYKRIAKEYSLKKKISLLENIFDTVSNEDELAEFLVASFGGLFLLAESSDIDIPKDLETALKDADLTASASDIDTNLALGDSGSDVVKLQSLLITLRSGPLAVKLANAGATGYFGPVTQSALIEYQKAADISPDGVFGPLTRSRMEGDTIAEKPKPTTPMTGNGVSFGAIATLIPKDIGLGATGPEVQILQLLLMLKNSGPRAKELLAAGATGYFGPMTQSAMGEFQEKSGIPKTGTYDARTREVFKSGTALSKSDVGGQGT